jgi:phosphopantetheine--protein transferase-like protein
MQVKTGIDLLNSKQFLSSLKSGGEKFEQRVFTPQEIRQNNLEQLASIFALKEAVHKALELPSGSWLKISTNRQTNGKVKFSLLDSALAEPILSLDSSISHDGRWIIAIAVIIIK